MEPITKFIVVFVLALLAAVIAAKRGRSGWLFFLVSAVGAIIATIVMSILSAGNDALMTRVMLGFPILVVIAAIVVRSGDQIAADEGSFRGKRKCPFCAESIRVEASKCKHCGSEITSA